MASSTNAGGPHIERELLAVLAIAVLLPVLAVIYSALRVHSADPVPVLAAASPTATVRAPTPEPSPSPAPTPYIPPQSEFGVAAVAAVAAVALSPEAARRASGPTTVDTSGFPPPPPRASAPPPNSAGIARIVAPGLQMDHYVEVVGIKDNQMQTPVDAVYAIGWYADYDSPGSGGNVIVSAHETWNHMRGPFFGLHRAAGGDEIVIEMVDGRRYRYAVFSNVRYSIDAIPMREIIWPSKRPVGEEWLTLITCGGRIVYDKRGFGEYLDRDVVIARRVG